MLDPGYFLAVARGLGMIGRRLGHYVVVARIGEGAMGEVYRATDQDHPRDVALKVLHDRYLYDEAARARFRRGAEAVSRLDHPNVASILEFGTDGGVDYLAMELVEGPSLDERLAEGPLAEPDLVRTGIQLATGIEAAHEWRILLRDIKTSNLRFTPDGRLKILDFGLARLAGAGADHSVTTTGGTVGTPAYLAPEQIRGERGDARSDLFAAGVVLYEMATGRRPFDDRHSASLMYSLLNESPREPRALRAELSSGIETVILKALEKDPERRYQSAGALRADLERLAG